MPVFVGRAHCAISRTIPLGLPQAPTHGAAQIVPYSGLDADPLEKYREKIQKLLDEMVRYKLEHYLKNHYRLPNPPTNAYKLTDTQYQRILKEYLTASSAVDSFTSNGVFVKNALNDVYRFLAFCAVVSGIIIGGAVGYSYWGGQVSPLVDQLTSANFFGWPKTEVHTCHMFNVDSSSMEALTNATIVTTLVDLDGVLLAKNLYCGLMLGLVFGFLDNLGLFFGMSNLDPIFYKFGTNVISGAIERNRAAYGNDEAALLSDDSKEQLVKIHDAANDLMAGLGNTFSGRCTPALSSVASTPWDRWCKHVDCHIWCNLQDHEQFEWESLRWNDKESIPSVVSAHGIIVEVSCA